MIWLSWWVWLDFILPFHRTVTVILECQLTDYNIPWIIGSLKTEIQLNLLKNSDQVHGEMTYVT